MRALFQRDERVPDRFALRRILVLCTGNICRSPMAAALLERELKRLGRDIEVRSAGLAALAGAPADPLANERMAERGLDLSGHRATAVRRDQVRAADLILVMEHAQRRWLLNADPAAAGKTFLLGHWRRAEVPDPYLQPPAAYDEVVELIDAGVADWIGRL